MKSNPIDFRRRKFLVSAGVGGAGAVAAVAGGTLLSASPPETLATVPSASGGYQATEHVRNYYRTARV